VNTSPSPPVKGTCQRAGKAGDHRQLLPPCNRRTGKSAQTYQEEIQSYPREPRAYGNVSIVYGAQGQYEKALETTRQVLRLAPDQLTQAGNLANYTLTLQRFDEARQVIREAQMRKADSDILHNALYALAFLGADSAAMAEQQQWYAGKPEENFGLALASDTEAYGGHLGKRGN
jgi:tetratricopeptide (TPR) repeat protein